jgi:hypothetical protein
MGQPLVNLADPAQHEEERLAFERHVEREKAKNLSHDKIVFSPSVHSSFELTIDCQGDGHFQRVVFRALGIRSIDWQW